MFDDPKESLRRLEQRLLAEEDREEPEEPEAGEDWLDEELAEAHRLLGDDLDEDDGNDMDHTRVWGSAAPRWENPGVRNYANGYGTARNTDPVDLDLEEYSDQVYHAPREKGIRGLVILACLETLGIVALVAYWLLVLL